MNECDCCGWTEDDVEEIEITIKIKKKSFGCINSKINRNFKEILKCIQT